MQQGCGEGLTVQQMAVSGLASGFSGRKPAPRHGGHNQFLLQLRGAADGRRVRGAILPLKLPLHGVLDTRARVLRRIPSSGSVGGSTHILLRMPPVA